MRFAFWGSEERVLAGSTKYVESLNRDQLNDIALYLNFDMLASPNPGYFTYDGDQSAPRTDSVPRVPEGSAGIERTLAGYLNSAGVRPADMPLTRNADGSPLKTVPVGFEMVPAGLPAGAGTLTTRPSFVPSLR